MKTTFRFILVIGAVVALALSVWNGVRAEKADPASNPSSIFNNVFLSRMLGANAVETQTPDVLETPQAGEDNQDGTPEASATSEVGDDNHGQNEPTEATEALETESHVEVTGTVTAIDTSTITVDGVAYSLTDFSEVMGTPQVGDSVKLEFVTNPDGTLSIREVKAGDTLSDSGDSSQSGHNGSDDQGSGNSSGDGGHRDGGGSGGHDGGGSGGGGDDGNSGG